MTVSWPGSIRPPSAPRCPLPASLAEAGKERIQAPGLGVEQGGRIEPGQLTVISHSASLSPATAIQAPPGATDNIVAPDAGARCRHTKNQVTATVLSVRHRQFCR